MRSLLRRVALVCCLAVLSLPTSLESQGQTFGKKLRDAKQFNLIIEGIDKDAASCGISAGTIREAFNYPASSAKFEVAADRHPSMPKIEFAIVTVHSQASRQCFTSVTMSVTSIEEVTFSYSKATSFSTVLIWSEIHIHYSSKERHEQNTRRIIESLTKKFITIWNLDNK